MNSFITFSRVFAVGIVLAAGTGRGQPESATPSEREDIAALKKASRGFNVIAEKAIPAVVYVTVERTVNVRGATPFFGLPFEFFEEPAEEPFGRRQRPRGNAPQILQQGQGSGFFISKDGYILSNSHVVSGADKIRVHLHDGRQLDAKLVGADRRSDVAVLKVEGNDFPFLSLGDSDAIQVGEWVIAIGTPFGLTETLTVGVVSAKGRNVGLTDYEDLIQTDAAINPGNSGGPLLNIDGKVIGITSSVFSQSGGYMGIGFAVPINMAASIQNQLVKTGKVVRGYLGVVIQDLTRELAKSFEIEKESGLLVSDVMTDSPAAKAGLKAGDVILSQDGKPIGSSASFRNGIALRVPGDAIKLGLLREGKPKDVTIEIGQQRDEEAAVVPSQETVAAKIGVSVQTLTPERRRNLNIPDSVNGVLVAEVEPGSLAALHGLDVGDLILGVNRQAVETAEQFMESLEQSKRTGRALLLVKNRRSTRFLVIPLE